MARLATEKDLQAIVDQVNLAGDKVGLCLRACTARRGHSSGRTHQRNAGQTSTGQRRPAARFRPRGRGRGLGTIKVDHADGGRPARCWPMTSQTARAQPSTVVAAERVRVASLVAAGTKWARDFMAQYKRNVAQRPRVRLWILRFSLGNAALLGERTSAQSCWRRPTLKRRKQRRARKCVCARSPFSSPTAAPPTAAR